MDRPPEPSELHIWDRISTNSLVRFLLFFGCGWAMIATFNYFQNVVFTFTFAAILAFLLNYPVRYLERFLGRGLALGVVIVVSLTSVIGLVVALGLTAFGQLQQLINATTQTLNTSNNPISQFERFLNTFNIQVNLLEDFGEIIRNALQFIVTFISGSLAALPNTFLTFIIILVVAFFMLIDGEKIWHLLLKFIPPSRRDRFSTAVKKSFLGFFRGQVLLCIFLSTSTFLVLLALRVPFALSLAIIVAVLDAIPGIGATLGVLTISSITLIQSGWLTAIKVITVCIILQQIQDNFVSPRIMQTTVDLNPVVVFFALMVGAKIAGLLGIFLSVPIAGVIVSLLEIEELQSEN